VLGYPLGALKPGFEDPPLFVSPLAFQCSECGAVTELLDTQEHGEGGELAKIEGSESGCSAYRGEGPRQPYLCPQCGVSRGEVLAQFHYHEDVCEDMPEDSGWEAYEDLFNGFTLKTQCVGCGRESVVSNIDTKY
jgi:hypothetical protein